MNMNVLIIVLQRMDCKSKILSEFAAAGIHGVSLVESHQYSAFWNRNSDHAPIFGGLRQILGHDSKDSNLIAVLDNDDALAKARSIVRGTVKELKRNTAVMFTIPAMDIEGWSD